MHLWPSHWATPPALFTFFQKFETGSGEIAQAKVRFAVFLLQTPRLLGSQARALLPGLYVKQY